MATIKKSAGTTTQPPKDGMRVKKVGGSTRPGGKTGKASPVTGHVVGRSSTREGATRTARYELRSKLTRRGQTTLPTGVRQALGIQPGEELQYTVHGDEVIMTRASAAEHDDPLISSFLAMIERDTLGSPKRMMPAPRALVERMAHLTRGVRVDLDEPIDGEVAL